MARRVTSRDYGRPARPLLLRLAHAVCRGLGARGPSLTGAALESAARDAEGLEDFGDPAYREPLARLLAATESEAALHPTGRLVQRARLIGILRNRLRAEAIIAANPEIAARPIVAPIVVTGLPRTGTTLLQRLIAAHPEARAMRTWEGANPAPFAERRDSRRLRARAAHRVIATLAPDFLACHPIEPGGIDEEIVLIDHSLMSSLPEVMMHVPSYGRWHEAQGQGPAYRLLKRMLQLLDWQRPGARWVLKTPQHLEFVPDLLAVFPDAHVIQVHRAPEVAVASTCSMVAHARGMLSDVIDPAEVGRRTLAKTARLIAQMAVTRAASPAGRFIDVFYDALVGDPVGEARRVARAVDLEWGADVEAAITRQSAMRDHERFGKHVYALADFAVSDAEIDEYFGAYRRRFGL